MNSLVSVIVPVYKVPEKYLRQCIESIQNQTLKEIEIILVDDGSPDDCGKICDEYATIDNRIKVIHKENGGVSSARNKGLDVAAGKYIMFVDSDDWLEINAVENLVLYYNISQAGLVVCGYYKGLEKIVINDKKKRKMLRYDIPMAIAGKYNYVMGYLWNKLFLRDIIELDHIRFDEDLFVCEDNLFCQKYAVRCSVAVCVPMALYHYRINAKSVTHCKYSKKNCTVFFAYKRIIELCDNYYANKKLNKRLFANYYTHYILNLKRIKNELQQEEWKEFLFVYDFVRDNILKILNNKLLKLKRKLLAIYLLLFFKS